MKSFIPDGDFFTVGAVCSADEADNPAWEPSEHLPLHPLDHKTSDVAETSFETAGLAAKSTSAE
jgi:hypothetical protein